MYILPPNASILGQLFENIGPKIEEINTSSDNGSEYWNDRGNLWAAY